jgi:hypothetical protein
VSTVSENLLARLSPGKYAKKSRETIPREAQCQMPKFKI